MTLFLAFLIGFLAGLRSLTPPAAVAWAAHLGWLKLHGALALAGSVAGVAILSLLAVAELIADKLPFVPNRTSAPGLIARVITGGAAGACIAIAGGLSPALGAMTGASGGVVGAFAGYFARTRSVKALKVPDIYVALAEDLIAIAGSAWVVSRF